MSIFSLVQIIKDNRFEDSSLIQNRKDRSDKGMDGKLFSVAIGFFLVVDV